MKQPFIISGNPTIHTMVEGILNRGGLRIKSCVAFGLRFTLSNWNTSEIYTNTDPNVFFILTGAALANYESATCAIQGRGVDNIPLCSYTSIAASSIGTWFNTIAIANKWISTVGFTNVNTRLQITGYRIEFETA
jgi:hypothetical protein